MAIVVYNSACCSVAQSRRSRGLKIFSASGLSFLQASKPLSHKGVGGCKHPTKPVPLRRLPNCPTDLVVELVILATPWPSCVLPSHFQLPQDLAQLVALDAVQPNTVALHLQRLETRVAALPDQNRRLLASSPAFIACLERSLEVVGQRGMGPAAPLLLLRMLSLLRFDDDSLLREAYTQFHRHLATALEDASKRDSHALTPQALLRCYEAWASVDLVVAPLKSSVLVLKLRHCLQGSKMSTQECARLLVALAAIRRKTGGQFSPCNYDISDTVSGVVVGIQSLGEGELSAVAQACSVFDWPVYRSPLWLLDCVAQEAIRRASTQAMPLLSAERLLGQAVAAAHDVRPRLGRELQGRIQEWALQAAAGAATAAAAQGMCSWAEAAEAASTLSNVVAFSLAQQEAALLH